MRKWLALGLIFILWACAPDVGRNDSAYKNNATYPVFDPTTGVIPLPNDVLIGSDGTVNIPVPEGVDCAKPSTFQKVPEQKRANVEFLCWLNSLNGFLPQQDATVNCSQPIDESTAKENTVLFFDITQAIKDLSASKDPKKAIQKAAQDVKKVEHLKFTFNKDKNNLLTISHQALIGGHKYLVVVTTDIKDKNKQPIVSGMLFDFLKSKQPLVKNGISQIPLDVDQASQLEALRQKLQPLFSLLEAGPSGLKPITRDKVAMLWSFSITTADQFVFDPDANRIPLPNDLLRKDGKLNFPLPDGVDCKDPKTIDTIDKTKQAQAYFFCWMNSLDGFSALSVPEMEFSKPLDSSGLKDGIFVYEVDGTSVEPVKDVNISCATTANNKEDCTKIVINHGVWSPGKTYMVVASTLLSTQDGSSVVPSPGIKFMSLTSPLAKDGKSLIPDVLSDDEAVQLESIRSKYAPLLDAISDNIDRSMIVGFFTFTITKNAEMIFDPVTKIVPFPNDMAALNPLTGKVNLPIPDDAPTSLKAILQGLNQLDGFSTYSVMQIPMTRPVDPSSVKFADSLLSLSSSTVAVLDLGDKDKLSPGGGADIASIKVRGKDYYDITTDAPAFLPVPKGISVLSFKLKEGAQYLGGHEYLFGFKKGLKATDGKNTYDVIPPALSVLLSSPYPLAKGGKSLLPQVLSDKDAAQLEMARTMYFKPLYDALKLGGLKRSDILMMVLFRTLNTTKALNKLVEELKTDQYKPSVKDFKLVKPGDEEFDTAMANYPHSHIDAICLNCTFNGYVRLQGPDLSDPQHPILGKFGSKFDKATFRYIFVVPKGQGPFKLLLFQHGLGGNAMDLLKWADELANYGFASIAIDAPYHGSHPINIDGRGTGFFSTDVFAVADNLKEAALDHIQAIRFAKEILPDKLKEASYPDLYTTKDVYYAGISLGGIIGGITTSIEPSIKKVALIVTAGHLMSILLNTQRQSFKQPLLDALAAQGIKEDSPEFAQFVTLAQWALDSGDPINFLVEPVDGITQDYKNRYIFVEARNDDFIPNVATNETIAAMKMVGESEPTFHVYPKSFDKEPLCHAFFLNGCDVSKYPQYKVGMDEAHKDVMDFLSN